MNFIERILHWLLGETKSRECLYENIFDNGFGIVGDEAGLRKLGVNLTCDPDFSSKYFFVG
jgi:hypothetical protein